MTSLPFQWMGEFGDLASSWDGATDGWESQFAKYTKHWRYYSGFKLEEKVNDPALTDPPLLYPVKMNLVKLMCQTQADALWGEWTDYPFTLEVMPGGLDDPSESDEKHAKRLKRFFNHVFLESAIAQRLWESGLDANRYGGAVLRVRRDNTKKFGVSVTRVPVFSFYPIFDPDNPNDLIEVVVAERITKHYAKWRYGIDTFSEEPVRVERWTKSVYENYIDGKLVPKFSGANPIGKVPFVYIPRLRSDGWYGEALTDDIVGAQDELNMRVADVGEWITYSSHPIKWGYNLPSDIDDTSKFPFSPDALWNLGRFLPGSDPPSLNLLEPQNPIPAGVFEHIRFVLDWGRFAGYAPAIAFGEDEGSQRSGVTLTIRMWPLTRSVNRTRLYFSDAILKLLDLIVLVAKPSLKGNEDIISTFNDSLIRPRFAPVLPRERAEIVNEVVQRMSTPDPTLSQSGALEMLSEGDVEFEMQRLEEAKEEQEQKQNAIDQDSMADGFSRDLRRP